MLKLVVMQSGLPDREFVVPGDAATIGRVSSCEVVIDEPFVSKQHLRILHGTVVVDLGSSNGTFIDGQPVTHGVLLAGRTVAISQNGVELRVASVESEADTAVDDDEVENLRSEFALLEAEVARLTRELAKARDTSDQDELVGRLQGENEGLRERLVSLKDELEDREVEDGGSVQAKLAMQRVENVQELNAKLQDDIDRLRAELDERGVEVEVIAAAPRPEADNAELFELRRANAELQAELSSERQAASQHEKQTRLVRKLRQELEALRAGGPAAGAPELELQLEESRSKLAQARAHAAELEGRLAEGAPPPEAKVSDLFFKLQSENTELRQKLAALEDGPGSPGPGASGPGQRDMKTVKELMEARLRITALETEISNLKVTNVRTLPPVPAKSAAGPQGSSSSAGRARQIFGLFVEQDIEGLTRPTDGPVEDFLMIESLRLLRHVERVVTRVAGDLIQLFQLQTMLPDTIGTYRDLVGDLLSGSKGDQARDQLVEYFETLGRWLVASIGSHRQAAVLFAEKIKQDLSEKSLVAREPLPSYARVPMLAGNELWHRTQEYLTALSPDAIDEGIDNLAREQAQRILNQAP